MSDATPDPALHLPRPTVLVVEDQAIIRHNLVDELLARGFAAFEAADAEAGIALFLGHPEIDAAVVDIDLPGRMDGYGLVRAIRRERPRCSVVIVSGSPFTMPADFDEHVVVESKPCDVTKIALVLRMRHAENL